MWYVIQTVTGKEEELITFIRTILKEELFTDCFLLKAEWLKRLGGDWQIQMRPLFPGYIFIETEYPEIVFIELKEVPKFSRILGNGKFEFIPVNEEEKRFLTLICNEDGQNTRIVRLTEVTVNEDGSVASMHGMLQHFRENIVKMNLHKRFALVKLNLFHGERTLIFGITLRRNRKQREK